MNSVNLKNFKEYKVKGGEIVLYVRFCGEPKEYPIEVLNIVKLRSQNLIGVTQFRRLMRRFGITYTKALIYQGCYERGEFEILSERGVELKEMEKAVKEVNTKIVDVYHFECVIRVKYKKTRGHELFLEARIEGNFEKTEGIPIPNDDDMQKRLKELILEKFEEFMVDFFTHNLNAYLQLIRGGELDCEFEEFEIVDQRIKAIDEPLEGEITYIHFSLGRSETGRWTDRDDLANAMHPYMEDALRMFLDYVMEQESAYLTISARAMYRRIREYYKRIEDKLISTKIKERIAVAKNITDLEDILKLLNEYLEKGKISYRDYQDYFLAVQIRAREILNQQLMKWIERIEQCQSIPELNEIMRKIMHTVTYRSVFFDPLRYVLEEAYIKKLNELSRVALKEKVLTLSDIHKMILTRYLEKLRELIKTGYDNPHMLRRVIVRLRRTIRRIERSKLPEDIKAQIISAYEEEITKLIEFVCQRYKKVIPKAENIEQLNNLEQEIETNKRYLQLCYDELRKLLRERRKELRKKMYSEYVKEIMEAKPEELKKMQANIYQLPIRTQYSVFKELLEKAENLEVLNEVYMIVVGSPIAKEDRYADYFVKLRALYNKRRSELLWGK